MAVPSSFVAREEKPPFLAMLVPPLYLLACALAVRSVLLDRSMDIGIAGLLVALGLAPAFTIPAIFSTRSARIEPCSEGLLVDGRLVKINGARVTRAPRGTGKLHVEARNGETRTFILSSYAHAQDIVASLPPVSVPSGALAA